MDIARWSYLLRFETMAAKMPDGLNKYWDLTGDEFGFTGYFGYKNPPTEARWKPGQSGNPKCRPRGSKNFKTGIRQMFKLARNDAKVEKSVTMALVSGLCDGNKGCTEIVRDALRSK